ncbi:RHS repeat domain-containing protein [Chryseobacterium phocaeense]|uniref:RHS repeat domain-containing protein n=1 Tax=Chryseobacterium phocaeense TaxID=1816690 RepID=UPI00373FCF2A
MKKLFSTVTTDSLDGFQYANGTLRFFPTAEGYYNAETGKYVYNYTDHLGNTRLSYFKNGAGAEIIEESNYYPFGLKHEGYNVLGGNPAYKYKYNGKELQESGMYDYGARFYMPDVGRWGVIDPLAETSRRWSIYTYAYNNPIRFIDPDGMQNQDITFGKNISAETQNKIVSDLEQETGLKLSIGDNGKLSYTEPSDAGGSKTARDMIKGAIDNHRTVYSIDSDNSKGSSISGEPTVKGEWIGNEYGFTSYFDLNINTEQIDAFISGTSEALNPLTMGYGMTTLHEVSHRYNNLIDGIIGDDGRELSATSIYGMQGDNEKKVINVIRTELDNSKAFKLPFGQRKSYSPMNSGGFNFSAFSSEAQSKGPLKVDPKKDLYIKTPQR